MKRLAIGLVAGALVLTACQSASETLTERALEQIDGVDGVDIDVDSGEVSLETEDGKVTIGGGEVPDGFDIPLPDGYVVNSVFTNEETKTVGVYVEGADFDEIVGFYQGWIDSQAGEWTEAYSETTGLEDGNTLRNQSWTSEESSSFITVDNLCVQYLAAGGEEWEAVCVNVVQSE
jgi:hypothetical protein